MNKFKKHFKLIFLFLILLSSTSCDPAIDNEFNFTDEDKQAMLIEMEKSFNFFYQEVQKDETSPAYGLIADQARGNVASIASVGFGLAAIPIGIEYKWITYNDGKNRVYKTLETIDSLENINGFYAHFLNMETGARHENVEISVIDTAIMVIGALIAGQYFGDEVLKLANDIYAKVNWLWYTGNNPHAKNKPQFYMGYNPDIQKFSGYWDFFAEQLMLYVLGAAAPNESFRTTKVHYDSFAKQYGAYDGENFIYSWFGSLFTHQFSHAFIDFSKYLDADGIDWFQNSVDASIASYDYCVDNKNIIKTFSENSWGLTACETKFGYSGYLGTPPRGWSPNSDYYKIRGTVAPAAALGSMPFTPKESLQALKHYQSLPDLNGKYGLFDAYDLENNWYSTSYIGIDKGITLLMLANTLDGQVWKLSEQNDVIRTGLERIGFVNK